MTGLVKISIWHNVTRDGAGRHTGPLGFNPGDQMVKAFTYTTQARAHPAAIAEDAFAAFNNAPHTSEDAGLAHRYFGRRLRSPPPGPPKPRERGRLIMTSEPATATGREPDIDMLALAGQLPAEPAWLWVTEAGPEPGGTFTSACPSPVPGHSARRATMQGGASVHCR